MGLTVVSNLSQVRLRRAVEGRILFFEATVRRPAVKSSQAVPQTPHWFSRMTIAIPRGQLPPSGWRLSVPTPSIRSCGTPSATPKTAPCSTRLALSDPKAPVPSAGTPLSNPKAPSRSARPPLSDPTTPSQPTGQLLSSLKTRNLRKTDDFHRPPPANWSKIATAPPPNRFLTARR